MTTLASLNTQDRDGFVAALGWVFEGSPWVASRAWEQRPFATLDALHDAMTSAVAEASLDEQLALLRAHPDLGARAEMSEASSREQAGAGLEGLAREDFDRLHKLNAAYRGKFGFPFLFAVKGAAQRDVLDALERRLLSTRDVEHREALRQVSRIARFRLDDTVTP